MRALAKLVGRIPAATRAALGHVAIVFVATFVATAKMLLPDLAHVHGVAAARAAVLALLAAAVVAAAKAAWPLLVALAKKASGVGEPPA